jgi:AbrB family looped-hinge helix DNA binding protein
METMLSSKGQVVIPAPIREKMGMTPGTKIQVRCDGGKIILEAKKKPFSRWLKARAKRPPLQEGLQLDRSQEMPSAPEF